MKVLRPLKAIRAKCLDCSSGSFIEVKNCPITTCPIYPYRLGKRPVKTGKEPIESDEDDPDNQEYDEDEIN